MAQSASRGDRISVPLYAAGLAATLCGVLTVADTIDDKAFTLQAVALTLAGFVFSLGCRVLRISARFVGWLCVGFIAVSLVGTLTDRVDWGGLVPESVSKNDARVAVVLCWAGVLLSWTLLQDATVLFTPLVAVAAIGLTASFDLNDYVATYFAVLLIATIFLLTHYQSLRVWATLGPTETDRAPRLDLPAQTALATLCGVVVLGLGVLLIVPVEAVSRNLSVAGAIRRLASFSARQSPDGEGIRFSDDSDFEIGTGMGWSASAVVLARMSPSDGQPHLWRGRTYDRYEGSGWVSTLRDQWRPSELPITDNSGNLIYPLRTMDYPGRQVLFAQCTLLGDTNEFYYAAVPRRLVLPPDLGTQPRLGEDGRLDLADERPLSRLQYTVASLIPPDPMDPAVQDRVRHAGTGYPPTVRALYLGNMADTPDGGMNRKALAYFQRVTAACVRRLPRDRRTPIDIALTIRDWVSNRCVYSLDVQPLPPDEDHVYDFLAHTRRGYCDLFASSMAVLCRVAGIPARVATGFAPGTRVGTAYELRALDKHAWTEVYFPRYGWLQFDATMGTRTDGSVPDPANRPAWTWAGFLHRLGPLPAGLALAICAILLYVAWNEWSAWRRRTTPTPARPAARATGDVSRRYARLTRALSGLRLVRSPAETPNAFAERVAAFLRAHPAEGLEPALVAAVTLEWSRSRYGGGAQPSDAEADRAVRRFAAAAGRLRRRLLWEDGRQMLRSWGGRRVEDWN